MEVNEMWKAKIDIGDYKTGDVVPDEIAVIWNTMYKETPVENVDLKPVKSIKPEVKDKIEVSPMLDDYLARNTRVVLSAIDKDNLDQETLQKLLTMEIDNKDRFAVKKALTQKVRGE